MIAGRIESGLERLQKTSTIHATSRDIGSIRVDIGAWHEHFWDNHVENIGQGASLPRSGSGYALCSSERHYKRSTIRNSSDFIVGDAGAVRGCRRRPR
jgi:hypothetical protein